MFGRFGVAALAMVALSALAPAAQAQSPAIATASPTARVWFYQDLDPYVSSNYATVSINGVVAGSVQPYGGSLYRDVPAGHYRLTADSVGTDVNQFADVDLAPGQEVYVKIMNLPSWDTGFSGFQRDTFYVRLVPTAAARAELAQQHRF